MGSEDAPAPTPQELAVQRVAWARKEVEASLSAAVNRLAASEDAAAERARADAAAQAAVEAARAEKQTRERHLQAAAAKRKAKKAAEEAAKQAAEDAKEAAAKKKKTAVKSVAAQQAAARQGAKLPPSAPGAAGAVGPDAWAGSATGAAAAPLAADRVALTPPVMPLLPPPPVAAKLSLELDFSVACSSPEAQAVLSAQVRAQWACSRVCGGGHGAPCFALADNSYLREYNLAGPKRALWAL
jgi:hypothetical protein